jgi:hypothetical protein
MKTMRLRLVLDVELDPQEETELDLIHRMNQVVRDAVNNGTLTGDSPATIEHYEWAVQKIS